MCSENANAPIIRAEGLSKTYRLFSRPRDRLLQFLAGDKRRFYTEVHALNNVSFSIERGESVGIIGRNGSGKSTLLQLICGILTPTHGALEIHGRISALLELGAGFNPEFTGRENVYLYGSILGLSRDAITQKFEDIAAFAGIGAFIEQPVSSYSSGMFVRLAFAVAIAVEPDILVVDEALAVGDEAFQRKCYQRIRALQERGTTILFVSHAPGTIMEICSRALWIDAGELLLDGAPKRVIGEYQKLIYAPAAAQPALRAQIQRGEENGAPTRTTNGATNTLAESRPESRIDYTSRGGTIHHPHVTTLDGTPTQTLFSGETYLYRYTLQLTEAAEMLKCGMLIKTPTGTELGGATAASGHAHLTAAPAGTTINVQFRFHCRLRAGTYYLNCGVSKHENGEDIFIHRILDACQIRVLPGDPAAQDTVATGLIDFDIACEAHISSPSPEAHFSLSPASS